MPVMPVMPSTSDPPAPPPASRSNAARRHRVADTDAVTAGAAAAQSTALAGRRRPAAHRSRQSPAAGTATTASTAVAYFGVSAVASPAVATSCRRAAAASHRAATRDRVDPDRRRPRSVTRERGKRKRRGVFDFQSVRAWPGRRSYLCSGQSGLPSRRERAMSSTDDPVRRAASHRGETGSAPGIKVSGTCTVWALLPIRPADRSRDHTQGAHREFHPHRKKLFTGTVCAVVVTAAAAARTCRAPCIGRRRETHAERGDHFVGDAGVDCPCHAQQPVCGWQSVLTPRGYLRSTGRNGCGRSRHLSPRQAAPARGVEPEFVVRPHHRSRSTSSAGDSGAETTRRQLRADVGRQLAQRVSACSPPPGRSSVWSVPVGC